jgi:hypothetical protein
MDDKKLGSNEAKIMRTETQRSGARRVSPAQRSVDSCGGGDAGDGGALIPSQAETQRSGARRVSPAQRSVDSCGGGDADAGGALGGALIE